MRGNHLNDLNQRLYNAVLYKNVQADPNSVSLISSLLEEGADPNLDMNVYFRQSSQPRPILSYAISMAIPDEISILLIAKGANVNQANNFKELPLASACYYGRSKIVRALLENNANVNDRTYDGGTALHSAVRGGGSSTIIQMLLNEGINQLIRDENGKIAKDHIALLPSENTRKKYTVLLDIDTSSLLTLSFLAIKRHQRAGSLPPLQPNTLCPDLNERALEFGIKFT